MSGWNDFNQRVVDEFRANAGKIGGQFAGEPMMLLTHTGAKSGQQRVSPVVYTRDGDNVVIVASRGGGPTNPDWYHNLVANPEATVEVGSETFKVKVREAKGEERDRLYAAHAALIPSFAEYQKKTDRVIPVLLLERSG